MAEKMDLTGQKFGRLTVLYEAESYRDSTNHLRRKWHCRCDCGVEKDIPQHSLLHGHTLSCGCYGIEARRQGKYANRSKNDFYIISDYCAVVDNSGNEFYIDIEDMDKVAERYWYVRKSDGYVYSHNVGSKESCDSKISLHEFLTGEKYLDHENHDPSDNRRCNLRVRTNSNTTNQGFNNINHKKRKDNTSGYTGVAFDNQRQKWMAYIGVNYKTIDLGRFDNIDDAIKARQKAEKEYYPNFNYDESMGFTG